MSFPIPTGIIFFRAGKALLQFLQQRTEADGLQSGAILFGFRLAAQEAARTVASFDNGRIGHQITSRSASSAPALLCWRMEITSREVAHMFCKSIDSSSTFAPSVISTRRAGMSWLLDLATNNRSPCLRESSVVKPNLGSDLDREPPCRWISPGDVLAPDDRRAFIDAYAGSTMHHHK